MVMIEKMLSNNSPTGSQLMLSSGEAFRTGHPMLVGCHVSVLLVGQFSLEGQSIWLVAYCRRNKTGSNQGNGRGESTRRNHGAQNPRIYSAYGDWVLQHSEKQPCNVVRTLVGLARARGLRSSSGLIPQNETEEQRLCGICRL